MRRDYPVYGVRRGRQRVLAVALTVSAVAALAAVIVTSGRRDSRRESRSAVRLPARVVVGWVPPALAPVLVVRRAGRLRQLSALGSDHAAAAGGTVGGSDGAVVSVTGRLGQRCGWDRRKPRAGKRSGPDGAGRRAGAMEPGLVRADGGVRGVCRPVVHVGSRSARVSAVRPAGPATAGCSQAWIPLRTRAPRRKCSRPPTSCAGAWWATCR